MENIKVVYNGFVDRGKDIKDGRFIMSSNNISQLLRYIASNKALIEYIEESNSVVDYNFEYNKAIIQVGTSKVFKLPQNNRKIVALVTGILYDFDRKTKNILLFLKEYFTANDIDVSFSMFCDSVIMPYIDAFADLVNNKQIVFEDADEEQSLELSQTVREQLVPFIINLSELVVADMGLNESKRKEYLDILEGLCYIIEDCNTKILKAMWIGLKNTMQNFKLGSSAIKGIENILTTYSLL